MTMPKLLVGKQERVRVGNEQDYPGSYPWPIYAYRCPECGEMVKQVGDVSSTSDDGHDHFLCVPCGQAAIREWDQVPADDARL